MTREREREGDMFSIHLFLSALSILHMRKRHSDDAKTRFYARLESKSGHITHTQKKRRPPLTIMCPHHAHQKAEEMKNKKSGGARPPSVNTAADKDNTGYTCGRSKRSLKTNTCYLMWRAAMTCHKKVVGGNVPTFPKFTWKH